MSSTATWQDHAALWLTSRQEEIEAVCARAADRIGELDAEHVPAYQRLHAFRDQYELSKGGDLCYDRPGTGFAYATWYHPRRVHEMVRRLLPLYDDLSPETTILDLGAGTGATAWAIALTELARLNATSVPLTPRAVVAIDASPSMLEAGAQLWEELRRWAPDVDRFVTMHSSTRAWLDPPDVAHGGWVVAGHLFDASDPTDEVRLQFRRMLVRTEPERVLIDAPLGKQLHLLEAATGGSDAGWETCPPVPTVPAIWNGSLPRLGDVRRRHLSSCGANAGELKQVPNWAPRGPDVVRADLKRSGEAGAQLFALGPVGLALDDDQDERARPRDRFELLIGAAGSGKSVVLVERIARTILDPRLRTTLPSILVTTRNVPMIDQLADWLVDRLGAQVQGIRHRSRAEGDHLITWSTEIGDAEVRLLNWDKVPSQVFGMSVNGTTDETAIRHRIRIRRRQEWSAFDQHGDYLDDVEWLSAELRRVIHGQRIRTRDAYLDADRVGRIRPLPPQIRHHVWDLLMDTQGVTGHTHRWMFLIAQFDEALDQGDSIEIPGRAPFSHAFVDEVQDLTDADIKLLASMVPDPRTMFCAGDGAQAMLLGGTFDVPGLLRRRMRETKRLSHSYRLSRRLAEAVQPLAQSILDESARAQQRYVGIPTGTRSGVLGCRPIVLVDGPDLDRQLAEVVRCFEPWLSPANTTVTLAEGQRDAPTLERLSQLLPAAKVRGESMAKIKGLERTCVIWRTRQIWELDESVAEFVHTTLTRPTSLAVVLVDPDNTPLPVRTALSQLRVERLLFWDDAADRTWRDLVR
ncbi:MAG: hypothetical protein ACXIVQ_16330 [Acidimicrobiales bacterium]